MREKGTSAPKGFYHFMVNKFLKNVENFSKGKWAKEIKLSKKLFNSCPDVRFWNQVELDFELNSLAWLLSEEGSYALKVRGKMMKYSPKKPKEYKMQKRRVGKKSYVKKKKTLIEILDESKKN
jgi:hypothetical protein